MATGFKVGVSHRGLIYGSGRGTVRDGASRSSGGDSCVSASLLPAPPHAGRSQYAQGDRRADEAPHCFYRLVPHTQARAQTNSIAYRPAASPCSAATRRRRRAKGRDIPLSPEGNAHLCPFSGSPQCATYPAAAGHPSRSPSLFCAGRAKRGVDPVGVFAVSRGWCFAGMTDRRFSG